MNTAMNTIIEVQREYQRQLREVSSFFTCGSFTFDYRTLPPVVDYCGLQRIGRRHRHRVWLL